ncbi:MAG: TrkA family potassium uptake protein [Spirochaetaceae bacterium]|jgi:trk system potassium uptake protein TrkA|nr:TrkA family potassium uptake protein [Spirochaetaceae bacterium]
MFQHKKKQNIAVLGLGRFGTSLVKTLSEYKISILACDHDENHIKEIADYATHAIQIDISDEIALKSLGLENFDIVIIATSKNFEATLIATMVAKEHGVHRIIVKASNQRQKKILESLGIEDVILPEYEMGVKLARKLLDSNIIDLLKESELYTISEKNPLEEWVGKTIRQADVRRTSGFMILAVYRNGKLHVPVSPDWVIETHDILLLLHENKKT